MIALVLSLGDDLREGRTRDIGARDLTCRRCLYTGSRPDSETEWDGNEFVLIAIPFGLVVSNSGSIRSTANSNGAFF
jgi:hypothetical protein